MQESENSLSFGHTVANSSPSQEFVFSSIEMLRKGENQQSPQSETLIIAKKSNLREEEDLLSTVATKQTLSWTFRWKDPTHTDYQVHMRRLHSTHKNQETLMSTG